MGMCRGTPKCGRGLSKRGMNPYITLNPVKGLIGILHTARYGGKQKHGRGLSKRGVRVQALNI